MTVEPKEPDHEEHEAAKNPAELGVREEAPGSHADERQKHELDEAEDHQELRLCSVYRASETSHQTTAAPSRIKLTNWGMGQRVASPRAKTTGQESRS